MNVTWEDIFETRPVFELAERFEDGRAKTGWMRFGERKVEIKNGIPRFVPSDDYAGNFGLQWNRFRLTQLDSHTKLPLTSDRFWNNTRWKGEDVRGKTVLEVGSGAGRFTEILLQAGANVISFDLSSAVDANFNANAKKGNLLLFQASVYDLPVKDNFFDFVLCHGVLQHTPEPERAYRIIFDKLRPGGRISIDYYLKTWRLVPWSTPKYVWRPITSKMDPEKLLRIIRAYIPWWLPVDTLIKKIPKIGPVIGALTLVPCWNYYYLPLSKEQKKEWAIMDTFDALGARYDFPKTLREVEEMVRLENACDIEVFYGGNGVVANARKRV